MENIILKILNNKLIISFFDKIGFEIREGYELIKNILFLSMINSIMILSIMINKIHLINGIIILSYIYWLYKCNNDKCFLSIIIFFLLSTFLVENIWYSTHIDFNTYVIFIKPFLILLLLYKYLKSNKNFNEMFKDPIIIIVLIGVAINLINLFKENYSILDFVNGLYLYLFMYIFYLIPKKSSINFKGVYVAILILQMPLILFESIIYKDQDQITGIFGLHATNWSMIIISISIYYLFALYMEKKCKLKAFIITLIYCFSMFMFNETKMAFFIIPICLFIMLIISDIKYINKFKIVGTILIVIILGMIGIIKLYPSFSNILFNPKNLMDYAFNQHSGVYENSRMENFKYTNEVLLPDLTDKLLGVGQGRAVQNEDFSIEMYKREREYKGQHKSEIYIYHGRKGYAQNSLNIMLIEVGIIGVVLYFIMIIIMFYRAYKIYNNSSDYRSRTLAISYIMYLLTWIAIIWYADIVYLANSKMFFLIYSGIIESEYIKLKKQDYSE